jgi:putative glutathione S-transferase
MVHERKCIVGDESLNLLKLFDNAFDNLCKYPHRKDAKMAMAEELDQYIYPNVDNGVYRCGFARTQEAYAKAHALAVKRGLRKISWETPHLEDAAYRDWKHAKEVFGTK